jgi:hypothetical protein
MLHDLGIFSATIASKPLFICVHYAGDVCVLRRAFPCALNHEWFVVLYAQSLVDAGL